MTYNTPIVQHFSISANLCLFNIAHSPGLSSVASVMPWKEELGIGAASALLVQDHIQQ